MSETLRNARVEIDLDIIRNNASILKQTFAPAELCAVVKADGYGHGSVEVAKAAVVGGATRLAVALVEEGQTLREAGITVPILVLSEHSPTTMEALVQARLTPTVYTAEGVRAAAIAAANLGEPLAIHIKVNTGMNRVGAYADDALVLAQQIEQTPELVLEGVFTHFAVADEPENTLTAEQVERFNSFLASLKAAGIEPPLIHSANSAAALLHPELRMSMVRVGIALYGVAPSADVPLPEGVKPAMSVKAKVSFVKTVSAGERVSYGHRYQVEHDTVLATVPIGYADGLPRALAAGGGEVLIGGRRLPIAGTITMDQFMVDCGRDLSVSVGDEVVIIGTQGAESIGANEIGDRTGTIGYEIVCRIGPRMPRSHTQVASTDTRVSRTDKGAEAPLGRDAASSRIARRGGTPRA